MQGCKGVYQKSQSVLHSLCLYHFGERFRYLDYFQPTAHWRSMGENKDWTPIRGLKLLLKPVNLDIIYEYLMHTILVAAKFDGG